MDIKDWELDKTKFKDEKGRYITEGLFLETRYNADMAVYTLDGDHKVYKDGFFPSLKKLYIEEGDPSEYNFATKHLFDWKHWLRLQNNKMLINHIDEWRDELELSLRCDGIQTIINAALNSDSYQAGKWLADRGWVKRAAGRPTSDEIEKEVSKQAKLRNEFNDDFELLQLVNKDKG